MTKKRFIYICTLAAVLGIVTALVLPKRSFAAEAVSSDVPALSSEDAEGFCRNHPRVCIPRTFCHVEDGVSTTMHKPLPVALWHLAKHQDDYIGACKEPEPEPTPTPTNTSGDTSFDRDDRCHGVRPIAPTWFNVSSVNDKGEAVLTWSAINGQEVDIRFGDDTSGDYLKWGFRTSNDGRTVIKNLAGNMPLHFQLRTVNNGCKVGPWSPLVTPNK